MSSSGSDSGSELDYEEEMALRIALERSKVETCGSSGSGASPQLPLWRSADAGAGPSRPARSSARTAQSAPSSSPDGRSSTRAAVGASARIAGPHAHSKIGGVCHERQRARERDTVEQSTHRCRGMEADPDDDARVLTWVYHLSLTTVQTDACRLRRKNAKELRLAIEQSEHELKEAATEKALVARSKREQDRAVRRMKGLIVLSDSDSDGGDNCTSSSDDQDPQPAVDAYRCARDREGKGPARKW